MIFGQAQGDNILFACSDIVVWLLAMWLASDAVLPFDYVKYATQLQVNFVQSCERTDHAN
jgi:hypothetical protein